MTSSWSPASRNPVTDPLPGMPLRYGDPGLFICGPDDIAPWERPPAVKRDPAPRRASTGPRRWIVLATCPDCTTCYCVQHDQHNWWLENFRPGRGR